MKLLGISVHVNLHVHVVLNLSPGEYLRAYTGMMRSTSAFMRAHN